MIMASTITASKTSDFIAPDLTSKGPYQWHDEFPVTINGMECQVEACLPGRHADSDFDFYLYGEGVELCREVRVSELRQSDVKMIDDAFEEHEKKCFENAAGMAEELRFSEWKETRESRFVGADVRTHPLFATARDIFAE